MSLREQIRQEILAHGPIPFSRYMELCLYDADLGYYSRDAEKFGKAGDFYTSSDVHAVFGRLLARQFEEMWRLLGSPAQIEIMELGPGRGLFARDVLDWSEKKFPEFFGALHYSLAERSPSLRKKLEINLANHIRAGRGSLFDSGGSRLQRRLPADVPLIVFANEFFDALPVEVIGSPGQLYLTSDEKHFVELWKPPCPGAWEFLDRYGVHPKPGERVEVSLLTQKYAAAIASQVGSGFLVAVDYGYTRDEQLAGRHLDTITAFRQHSVSGNPYEAPGEQDITAHVNFTALAGALSQGAMQVEPLVTQSQFLLGIGEANQFADAFEQCRLPQERAKVALQLKHLVTPAGMGETFHVLVASKGPDPSATGRLSGLSFGKARI